MHLANTKRQLGIVRAVQSHGLLAPITPASAATIDFQSTYGGYEDICNQSNTITPTASSTGLSLVSPPCIARPSMRQLLPSHHASWCQGVRRYLLISTRPPCSLVVRHPAWQAKSSVNQDSTTHRHRQCDDTTTRDRLTVR